MKIKQKNGLTPRNSALVAAKPWKAKLDYHFLEEEAVFCSLVNFLFARQQRGGTQ